MNTIANYPLNYFRVCNMEDGSALFTLIIFYMIYNFPCNFIMTPTLAKSVEIPIMFFYTWCATM